MQQKTKIIKKYIYIFTIIGTIFPAIAFAAFIPGVPVEDTLLEKTAADTLIDLKLYKTAFDDYTVQFDSTIYGDEDRSLRTLLSLNPNSGVAAELYLPGRADDAGSKAGYAGGGKTPSEAEVQTMKACETRKIARPLEAKPGENGAWQELLKNEKLDPSNSDYSTVEVNKSTSLTCLLQEIVEQNKLQINLQIHGLLREYINSALSAGLAQRTAGVIAKANIDWVKKGNTITRYDSRGVPVSSENFSLSGGDSQEYQKSIKDARVRTLQQGILSPSGQGNSFNVCAPFKYSTARTLLEDAHKANVDPLDTMSTEVGCGLVNKENPSDGLFANESDITEYYHNAIVGNKSPLDTYMAMLEKPQNTEQGLAMKMQSAQGSQLTSITDQLNADYQANGGFQSSRQCDPNDPNCDIRYSKQGTPGTIVSEITKESALQQFKAISNAKTPEDVAAIAKDNYSSTNILTHGLSGYNTEGLIPNQNVSRYVADFLAGIQNGYFDIQKGTTDWASGAMLQIYDNTMVDPNAFTGADSTQDLPNDTTGE